MIAKEFAPISGIRSFAITGDSAVMLISVRVRLSRVTTFTTPVTVEHKPREIGGNCPR